MKRVAAIIVTFNRAELLQNCLVAVSAQTRALDAIYVIDNGSTDGTEDVVTGFAGSVSTAVHYRKIARNVGGAGGFSFGTRLAVADGFDWLWLMDDDGVPDRLALSELLSIDGPTILNSLVVDIDAPDRLAFEMADHGNIRTVAQAKEFGPFISGACAPFNGTLVHSSVFKSIGFPNQDFFIWGDEVDFIERARRDAFAIGTVTTAFHRHPSNKKPMYRLFGRFTVSEVNDEKRVAIFIRNYSHNLLAYKSFKIWLAFLIKQLAYEAIVKRSPGRFFTALKAAIFGATGFANQLKASAAAPYTPVLSVSKDWNSLQHAG